MEKKNEGQLSCACLDTRKTIVVCNNVVTRKCQLCLADLRRVRNKLRLIAYIVLTRRLRQGRDVSRMIVDKFEEPYMTHDGVYGDCALLTNLRYNVSLARVKHVGVHFPGSVSGIDQVALIAFVRAHFFETIQVDVAGVFATFPFVKRLMRAMQVGAHLTCIPRFQCVTEGLHFGIIRYQDRQDRKFDWVETDKETQVKVTHTV